MGLFSLVVHTPDTRCLRGGTIECDFVKKGVNSTLENFLHFLDTDNTITSALNYPVAGSVTFLLKLHALVYLRGINKHLTVQRKYRCGCKITCGSLETNPVLESLKLKLIMCRLSQFMLCNPAQFR